MFRTRLAGAALLSLTLLPGCGLFCGDRPALCGRFRSPGAEPVQALPVSYPVSDPGCGTAGIPQGGVIYGAPGASVFPGGTVIPGDSIVPGPPATPRIPRAGIEEGKGKQFELEGASRTGPAGPVLTMPAIKPGS